MGSNPCRWGAASGVECDGGVTVSSIVLFCGSMGGQLGGTLTGSLVDYVSLSYLVMSGCGLKGSLPARFTANNAFPSLRKLDLSNNRLSGPLPVLLGRPGNVKSLYVLDLAANSFSGTLPGQWAKNAYFPNLKLLSLNNNPQLNGIVPPAWGKINTSWPANIKINVCSTKVRGPLSSTMNGGSVQIFAQLSPQKLCNRLPATFAGAGYQAGVYPCSVWPTASASNKYRQADMPACA